MTEHTEADRMWYYEGNEMADVRLISDGSCLIVSGYVDGEHVVFQDSAHTIAGEDWDELDVAQPERKIGETTNRLEHSL